jgi:hypothetical protein
MYGGEVTEEGKGHDDVIGMTDGLIQSFIIVGPHGMAGFGAQQKECPVELSVFVAESGEGLGERGHTTVPDESGTEESGEEETAGEEPEREGDQYEHGSLLSA